MESLEPYHLKSDARVLCIAAHPDDLEYGASAAVAKWTALGARVDYLLLTAGEAGIRSQPPAITAPLRRREQQAACDAVGVSTLTILGFPDGLLAADVPLRAAIAQQIRRLKPTVILTPSWELDVPWGLNHADHRAAGLAVIDAARDADNPWLFAADDPTGPVRGGEEAPADAWGVSELLVTGVAAPTHCVDVSGEPFAAGVASLEAHKEYFAALGEHASAHDMFESFTGSTGKAVGVDNALPIRVYAL